VGVALVVVLDVVAAVVVVVDPTSVNVEPQ
jgi:hypothetical protein